MPEQVLCVAVLSAIERDQSQCVCYWGAPQLLAVSCDVPIWEVGRPERCDTPSILLRPGLPVTGAGAGSSSLSAMKAPLPVAA